MCQCFFKGAQCICILDCAYPLVSGLRKHHLRELVGSVVAPPHCWHRPPRIRRDEPTSTTHVWRAARMTVSPVPEGVDAVEAMRAEVHVVEAFNSAGCLVRRCQHEARIEQISRIENVWMVSIHQCTRRSVAPHVRAGTPEVAQIREVSA